jgi:site-specific recombinase
MESKPGIIKSLLQRFTRRGGDTLAPTQRGPGLDSVLARANPDEPLADRLDWAEGFFAWVRRDSPAKRLKLFLQLLDRQPDARERVTKTLRSLVRDTQALDLFADTGLPRESAFMREFLSRIFSRLLPAPPDSQNLDELFDRLFPHTQDSLWLERLDPETATQVVALFQEQSSSAAAGEDWSGLRTDLEDALVQLSDRICVVGSGREVRRRLPKHSFRELPFQRLAIGVEALLEKNRAQPGVDLGAELNHVRALIEGCDRALDEVTGQLEHTGVNTAFIYDLARLQAQLRRLEILLETWASPEPNASRTLTLVADLVRQNHSRKSVFELCRQNLHLLTRRIVERSAETGEHYVARNGREYLGMLWSAAGGGAVMGFATVIKFLLAKLSLAEFFKGMAFGLNYAIDFSAIQLLGFTLATKQPANTAPALSRRMEELRTSSQLEALVDEVVMLFRSQTAAVVGNLALVIPVTALLEFALTQAKGHHLLSPQKAMAVLHSVSPLSGAWLFAALTGVMLWLSSVIAAWVDNWFALHQLGPALAQHRQLQQWLGPSRTRRAAQWLGRNIAGLSGNISLGFMLGLTPEVAGFFGLPLDIRHVTVSTGQVTAAIGAIGLGNISGGTMAELIIGILGIGALNLMVSFGLAMFVAIRANAVRGPERNMFFRGLAMRVIKAPLSFIFPPLRGHPATQPTPEPIPKEIRSIEMPLVDDKKEV